MKVWIVEVSDCEGSYLVAVCATKEIAERELFKKRDELVAEYKKQDKYNVKSMRAYYKEKNMPYIEDTMYKDMSKALSGNDYKKWDNYPHDKPYLYEIDVINK